MIIILFALWIIFNGRLTTDVLVTGAVISALLYAFACVFMGYSPKQELAAVRRIPKLLVYGGVLLKEIFKANWAVFKFVYSPRLEVEPQVVSFKTKLKGGGARVMLANAITLTPGTITAGLEDDVLTVCCLDSSMVEGLENSTFEKLLLEMEDVKS